MTRKDRQDDGDAVGEHEDHREAVGEHEDHREAVGEHGDHRDRWSTLPGPLTLACAVIGLESLALAGLGVFLIIDTIAGHSSQVAFGLLSALFALLGAAALCLGARGLSRLSPAARTPIVVLQVLALPVAYSMAFQSDLVSIGGPIFVATLAVLYLLFTPPVRAVLDRAPRD